LSTAPRTAPLDPDNDPAAALLLRVEPSGLAGLGGAGEWAVGEGSAFEPGAEPPLDHIFTDLPPTASALPVGEGITQSNPQEEVTT
jgi:hypothetical protein